MTFPAIPLSLTSTANAGGHGSYRWYQRRSFLGTLPYPPTHDQTAGSIRFTSHKYARRRRDGSPFQHRAAAHGGGVSGSGWIDGIGRVKDGRGHSGGATRAACGIFVHDSDYGFHCFDWGTTPTTTVRRRNHCEPLLAHKKKLS